MNCRRAEELFSDEREGALAPPIERELSAHLDTCDECQSLYETFQEVADALGAMSVPAVPDALAEKVIDKSRHARGSITTTGREGTPFAVASTSSSPRLVASASWLAVAAVLAMVVLFRPPELASELSRKTSRAARHVYSFAIRTYDQTERWIEDLNVLRMTVNMAFEDRIDQLNEQLRDLENAGRRSTEDADEQSRRHLETENESETESGAKSGSGPMATRPVATMNDLGFLTEHSSRSLL